MAKPSLSNLASRLSAAAGTPVTASATLQKATPSPAAASARTPKAARPEPVPVQSVKSATAKARAGKTMIAGYFSPEMARAVKLLAVERDLTVQALIGEGLDMVLRQHGKHPMGER